MTEYSASFCDIVSKFGQTTSYGSLVAKIGEFRNKVSAYWQPFLDKIKSLVQVSGAGRQTWNGFKNIFIAKEDEILKATNRIKSHRTTRNLTDGNYGYLEGKVTGIIIDNKMW